MCPYSTGGHKIRSSMNLSKLLSEYGSSSSWRPRRLIFFVYLCFATPSKDLQYSLILGWATSWWSLRNFPPSGRDPTAPMYVNIIKIPRRFFGWNCIDSGSWDSVPSTDSCYVPASIPSLRWGAVRLYHRNETSMSSLSSISRGWVGNHAHARYAGRNDKQFQFVWLCVRLVWPPLCVCMCLCVHVCVCVCMWIVCVCICA